MNYKMLSDDRAARFTSLSPLNPEYSRPEQFDCSTHALHREQTHVDSECRIQEKVKRYRTVVVADIQLASAQLLLASLKDRLEADDFAAVSRLDEVLSITRVQSPALVISEVHLRGGNIVQLAEQLQHQDRAAQLIAYSRSVPQLILDRLLRLSVAGVISKTGQLEHVLTSIQQIACGQPDSSASAMPEVESTGSAMETGEAGNPETASSIVREMTDRQYAVLLLLAEGMAVKQVARRLSVSVKAVDSLKYRLMKQLNFHDRVQLTRFAIREGLIDP